MSKVARFAEHSKPRRIPRGYWKDLKNQRIFVDNIAQQFNITDKSGWYKVTTNQFRKQYGAMHLLNYCYNGSISKMLSTVYPEHNWDTLKFSNVPQRYWTDPNNQRNFLEKLAKDLQITTQKDWYKLTRSSSENMEEQD